MASVTIKQLLEAGVHFGHQTRRWNPAMEPYLYGERGGIHIIDLRQTAELIEGAYEFVRDTVAKGGTVLFVGTKQQVQAAVAEEATRAGMPYVNFRWLGGMLTNFQTIKKRIAYMRELERMDASGEMETLTKRERLRLRRELEKLQRNLGGVVDLQRQPDIVFVVDTNTEHIAVGEARRLGIPVVAICDSNSDPTGIEWVIPGNDDAVRSAHLIASVVADACVAGRQHVDEAELAAAGEEE